MNSFPNHLQYIIIYCDLYYECFTKHEYWTVTGKATSMASMVQIKVRYSFICLRPWRSSLHVAVVVCLYVKINDDVIVGYDDVIILCRGRVGTMDSMGSWFLNVFIYNMGIHSCSDLEIWACKWIELLSTSTNLMNTINSFFFLSRYSRSTKVIFTGEFDQS